MRELLLRGEFRSGERLREIPLAARLKVSRTPLRLVLDRLEQEGLLTARPTGGFVAAEFSVQDIHDGIEIRGMLEGTAAKLAAERLESLDDLSVGGFRVHFASERVGSKLVELSLIDSQGRVRE